MTDRSIAVVGLLSKPGPGSHFLRELLPFLARDFAIEFFTSDEELQLSDTADVPRFHFLRLQERNNLRKFKRCLVFYEDSPSYGFVRFALAAIPSLLIPLDLAVDRLFVDQPWQFLDPKDVSLESQLFSACPVVAPPHGVLQLQEHARNFSLLPIPFSESPTTLRDVVETIGYAGRYPGEDWAEDFLDAAIRSELKVKWLVNAETAPIAEGFIKLYLERRNLESLAIELVQSETEEQERENIRKLDLFFFGRHDLRRSPPTAFYRALAMGVPSLALDFGPVSEVPNSALLKIPVGRQISSTIFHAITLLKESRDYREILNLGGRRYIELVHDPRVVYADLLELLNLQTASELSRWV